MSSILFAMGLPLANYQCYTKEAPDIFYFVAYVTFTHRFHFVMSKGKKWKNKMTFPFCPNTENRKSEYCHLLVTQYNY